MGPCTLVFRTILLYGQLAFHCGPCLRYSGNRDGLKTLSTGAWLVGATAWGLGPGPSADSGKEQSGLHVSFVHSSFVHVGAFFSSVHLTLLVRNRSLTTWVGRKSLSDRFQCITRFQYNKLSQAASPRARAAWIPHADILGGGSTVTSNFVGCSAFLGLATAACLTRLDVVTRFFSLS